MLTNKDLTHFQDHGYLVVEGLLDDATLCAVRAEYARLIDRLYAEWRADGLVPEETGGCWQTNSNRSHERQ